MKLKCNVCFEGSVIDTSTREPNNSNDLMCCPYCDKQMAYAVEEKYSNKMVWHPIDTEFNKEWGGIPVEIISD